VGGSEPGKLDKKGIRILIATKGQKSPPTKRINAEKTLGHHTYKRTSPSRMGTPPPVRGVQSAAAKGVKKIKAFWRQSKRRTFKKPKTKKLGRGRFMGEGFRNNLVCKDKKRQPRILQRPKK